MTEQIITYGGSPGTIVWKSPMIHIAEGAILYVNEGQDAIFMNNGQMSRNYGPGKYFLHPDPDSIRSGLFTAGLEPNQFHSSVIYVNTEKVYSIKWGTSEPVMIQDPRYDVIVPVRAFGECMVRVSHTKKFLLKLTGYVQKFEEPEVFQFFRNTFLGYFRSNLTQYIIEHQVSFVDINAYSKEISGALLRELRPLLDEYGLELQHLQINTLSVPQDDPSFLKIKNSLAASKEQELLAKGKRSEMDILGYDYQTEKMFEVLGKAAEKNTSGEMGNVYSTLISSIMTGEEKQAAEPKKEPSESAAGLIRCWSCGDMVPPAKFCNSCGAKLRSFCPECGAQVAGNSRFCPECGYKIGG